MYGTLNSSPLDSTASRPPRSTTAPPAAAAPRGARRDVVLLQQVREILLRPECLLVSPLLFQELGDSL